MGVEQDIIPSRNRAPGAYRAPQEENGGTPDIGKSIPPKSDTCLFHMPGQACRFDTPRGRAERAL